MNRSAKSRKSFYTVAGICIAKETLVIDQQIFEVLEEPFVWYESPIVVEPEKNIVCNHRVVGGAATFGNSTIAGAEKWRVIGSVVGQHHELIQLTQNIGELS